MGTVLRSTNRRDQSLARLVRRVVAQLVLLVLTSSTAVLCGQTFVGGGAGKPRSDDGSVSLDDRVSSITVFWTEDAIAALRVTRGDPTRRSRLYPPVWVGVAPKLGFAKSLDLSTLRIRGLRITEEDDAITSLQFLTSAKDTGRDEREGPDSAVFGNAGVGTAFSYVIPAGRIATGIWVDLAESDFIRKPRKSGPKFLRNKCSFPCRGRPLVPTKTVLTNIGLLSQTRHRQAFSTISKILPVNGTGHLSQLWATSRQALQEALEGLQQNLPDLRSKFDQVAMVSATFATGLQASPTAVKAAKQSSAALYGEMLSIGKVNTARMAAVTRALGDLSSAAMDAEAEDILRNAIAYLQNTWALITTAGNDLWRYLQTMRDQSLQEPPQPVTAFFMTSFSKRADVLQSRCEQYDQ